MKEEKPIIKAVKIEEFESENDPAALKGAVDLFYEMTYKKIGADEAERLKKEVLDRREELKKQLGRPISLLMAILDVFLEKGLFIEPRLIEQSLVSELAEIALYDRLTGLYKRNVFDNLLEVEIRKHQRCNKKLSLAMMDIDDFKVVNDVFGHLKGDEVLSRIGELLTTMSRLYDIECRYGGEEIAIIMPDTTMAQAATTMERIRAAIEDTFKKEPYKVTVSIGIAELTQDSSRDTLIESADKALYEAKENGKNQVVAS